MHFGPDHDGLVWPKRERFSQMLGISKLQTVSAAIEGLERAGLIDVIHWPIYIGTDHRMIGGGVGRGRHNVYMMLHVDELGFHQEKQVRPSIAELEAVADESNELRAWLESEVLAGTPYNAVRAEVMRRYPFAGEIPMWRELAPSDDTAPESFGWTL